MGSSRLPGKSLLLLAGKPVLTRIIERLSSIPGVPVLVATSVAKADDVLADLCLQNKVPFVRGDEEDVLSRFLLAAESYNLDVLVRITGDSPLIDGFIVARMIEEFHKGDLDYYSNLRPRTLPRGFGCEIFRRALLDAAAKDKRPEDRGEHVVVPYVDRHLAELKVGNFRIEEDFSGMRLTLDEKADYELIRRIYDALYAVNKTFSYRDVVRFLEKNPELKKINAGVQSRNP